VLVCARASNNNLNSSSIQQPHSTGRGADQTGVRASLKSSELSVNIQTYTHHTVNILLACFKSNIAKLLNTEYWDCWEKCKCKSLIAGDQEKYFAILSRLLEQTNLFTASNFKGESLDLPGPNYFTLDPRAKVLIFSGSVVLGYNVAA